MSGPFKMKNSALKMSAKSGSPMQMNYAGMAKDLIGGVMSKKKEEETPAQYASPAKTDKKKMTAEEMQAASLAAAEKTEGITVSSKKYTDVTDEYAKKGSASTREHIASGGKVKKAADGSLKLTKSTN